jgi:hypothetical protein
MRMKKHIWAIECKDTNLTNHMGTRAQIVDIVTYIAAWIAVTQTMPTEMTHGKIHKNLIISTCTNSRLFTANSRRIHGEFTANSRFQFFCFFWVFPFFQTVVHGFTARCVCHHWDRDIHRYSHTGASILPVRRLKACATTAVHASGIWVCLLFRRYCTTGNRSA